MLERNAACRIVQEELKSRERLDTVPANQSNLAFNFYLCIKPLSKPHHWVEGNDVKSISKSLVMLCDHKKNTNTVAVDLMTGRPSNAAYISPILILS